MRYRDLPKIPRLKALMSYDPKTGDLRWRVPRRGRGGVKAGDIAGHYRESHGTYQVSIDGVKYEAARVAFALHHGFDPTRLRLYLRNKNRGDLRISNLFAGVVKGKGSTRRVEKIPDDAIYEWNQRKENE